MFLSAIFDNNLKLVYLCIIKQILKSALEKDDTVNKKKFRQWISIVSIKTEIDNCYII